MSESYQEKLRRHSYESRVDPLRDAVRHALAVWDREDDQEKNDLSDDFWRAMGQLDSVFRSVKRGGEEDVPEVEVTSSQFRAAHEDAGERSPVHVEAAEMPVAARRSGAKNVSAPEYQTAFISEARASMGQPSVQDAEALLGYVVTLTFNVDKAPVHGMLTSIIQHPASAPAYLVLDDNTALMYPLNSVQEIRRVR
jgi:hypothetical protein